MEWDDTSQNCTDCMNTSFLLKTSLPLSLSESSSFNYTISPQKQVHLDIDKIQVTDFFGSHIAEAVSLIKKSLNK